MEGDLPPLPGRVLFVTSFPALSPLDWGFATQEMDKNQGRIRGAIPPDRSARGGITDRCAKAIKFP